MASPVYSAPDTLDISCTYYTLTPDDENFSKLKKLNLTFELIKNKWFNFWSMKNSVDVISFSINLQNGNVVQGLSIHNQGVSFLDPYILSARFIAQIYPDYITIRGYPNGAFPDQNNNTEWEFNIDRINGNLVGTRFSPDDSFAPYYKKDDIMFSVNGECIPIKRVL